MACFSLAFWQQVCILIVIAIGLWSIIKLFLPWLMQKLPTIVIQIINIIIWVVIAIVCIVVIFALLQCLLSLLGGTGGLLRFPR